MKSFDYTVKDPIGIHARPAGLMAKKAKEFDSEITVIKGEKKASAKKLIALMGLCVKYNDTVRVDIDGADEDVATEEMKRFFNANL